MKLDNILFVSTENNYKDAEIKIIDFGLSIMLDDKISIKRK